MAATDKTTCETLSTEITGRRAWRRDEISARDWTVSLSPEAIDELERVISSLRLEPVPTLLLEPEDFELSACARIMGGVSDQLRYGIGLVVLDAIPVERLTLDESRAITWLLGSLLGRVVPTKWDGTTLYDVRDTGRSLEYGVRRSVTNLDLTFHTDAAWMDRPPEMVGLTCVNPALEGGVSRFVSLSSVHNELRRRHPRLLPRLYRPFPWDRQAEHGPAAPKTTSRPIFQLDPPRPGRVSAQAEEDRWMACYNERLIQTGASLIREELDGEGQEALAAMDAIVNSPELWVELVIQRGQVQLLNNRHFAHSRTEFRDAEDPNRKRHLIRFWTREEGRRAFHA